MAAERSRPLRMSALNVRTRWLLAAALLTGLLVRLPGVWWGASFPSGWYGHHPDEYTHSLYAQLLINPHQPRFEKERSDRIRLSDPWAAGYSVTPYPKGMAIQVAAPIVAWRWLTGVDPATPPPPTAGIIPPGRVISVLYGTASILLLFVLARQLFRDPRIALLSAWLLALGGLHVTQSHFFLADAAALCWMLLGTLLLWHDLADRADRRLLLFTLAAGCFGVAFGLKLAVASLPALGLAALMKRNWPLRVLLAGAGFLAGMLLINLGTYTPLDFYRTLRAGINDPFLSSHLTSGLLYLIELPTILSLPLSIAALAGVAALARRLLRMDDRQQQLRIAVVVVLPPLVQWLLAVFKLDHFPRHLIPLIPFLALCGAWAITRAADFLQQHARIPRALLPLLVLAWQAAFVYDGEKGFIREPRDAAARWVYQHVPKDSTLWWYYHSLPEYTTVPFPIQQPVVVLEEMHHANHYLKGIYLDGVMPRDYHYIFDSESQANIDGFQGLFTGSSNYHEVARFGEHYFMPEYRLIDHWIGNRSRNYLAEVVVFVRNDATQVTP